MEWSKEAKWDYLREMYQRHDAEIGEAAAVSSCFWDDPYRIDWLRYFTPPEERCWSAIRRRGCCLYPQFPVFNYFLDFAHPGLKVAVEVDGKRFHCVEKDRIRDERLWSAGWRVFRIHAQNCFAPFKGLGEIDFDFELQGLERESAIHEWLFNSVDGLIEAVRIVYFTTQDEKDRYQTHADNLWDLALQTLSQHRLVNFPL